MQRTRFKLSRLQMARLIFVFLTAGSLCVACAVPPPPPPSAVTAVAGVTARGEATPAPQVTAMPLPAAEGTAARIALIVDEVSNPELYSALTETAERTQSLRNYCASFELKQLTRAQEDEVTRLSLSAETCAYPSGDKFVRVAETQTASASQVQTQIRRELFKIGDGIYLKSATAGEEAECVELVDEVARSTVDERLPTAEDLADLVLSDVMSFTLTARAVPFEQFLVDQYEFNSTFLAQQDEQLLNLGSRGQIWFAPDLGTIVRQLGSFTGRLQITQDMSLDGSFSWEYRLRPTGFGALTLPEECSFSRSKEIPVFSEAVLVVRGAKGLEFLARTGADAIVAFYAEALPPQGWVQEYVELGEARIRSVKYVRGAESLFIYIVEERSVQEEAVVSVTILLD